MITTAEYQTHQQRVEGAMLAGEQATIEASMLTFWAIEFVLGDVKLATSSLWIEVENGQVGSLEYHARA